MAYLKILKKLLPWKLKKIYEFGHELMFDIPELHMTFQRNYANSYKLFVGTIGVNLRADTFKQLEEEIKCRIIK